MHRRVKMHRQRKNKSAQNRCLLPRTELLEDRRLLAADIEPNDSLVTATNLGSGSQFHSDPAIQVPGDQDWYRWTATSAGSVRVDALFSQANVDLVLRLLNANSVELAKSDTITNNERASIPVVPFDLACEQKFQELRAQGIRVGSQDLRIASTALVNDLVLVTRNTRDFMKIPRLRVEDWSPE